MPSLLYPGNNHLLAALHSDEWRRLAPASVLVALTRGEVLYQADGPMTHVYFPLTATIAVDYLLADGGSCEVNRIGNEGMLGVSLLMGSQRSPGRAVVHSGGAAYRLGGARLMAEFYRGGPLLRLLLRYTQARLTQVSQLATCNGHHTIRQRLCCYLLQMLDRACSNVLTATQEEIGAILGVRREGITDAARSLQALGIIGWKRGHVTVFQREGLHAHSCECYEASCQASALMLPPQTARAPALTGGHLPGRSRALRQ